MQAALADAGVAHIPFRQVKSEAELTRACDELGRWPLVVKPLNAGDTQDVLICENLTQAKAALHTIIGKVNRTEQLNEAALVESFIDGDEYVVNTVSPNGEHIITDIWRYDKGWSGSTRVCLRMSYCRPTARFRMLSRATSVPHCRRLTWSTVQRTAKSSSRAAVQCSAKQVRG